MLRRARGFRWRAAVIRGNRQRKDKVRKGRSEGKGRLTHE
jgi:hypothetical protein